MEDPELTSRSFTGWPGLAELPLDVVAYGPDIPTETDLRLLGRLEGKRVLELGCGGGPISVAMTKQGAKVIAVETSAVQLGHARRLCEREDVAVELHHGDLAELAFVRADTIDLVVSVYSLGMVPDLDRVFRQVHRVLRPDLPFVLSLPHPAWRAAEHTEAPALRRPYWDRTPEPWTAGEETGNDHPVTTADLFTSLTRAGFRVDTLLEPEPLRGAPRVALVATGDGLAAGDADRPRPEGRHLTEPGWHPDPWQPGGWRWHDGTAWTSWTGPPPVPYTYGPRTSPDDVAAERRLLPLGQLAIVGMAVAFAASTLACAVAFRDLLEPLVDLFGQRDPSQAEIDAVVDDITARQGDYWWVNLVAMVPLACLAGMAVWSAKVAGVGRGLGYPARHSTGWAAGGWFVPVVSAWFPYQSIVDSVSPSNPRRGVVLSWWLLYVFSIVGAIIAMTVIVFSDVAPLAVGVPLAVMAFVQALLGLRVVALVHEDHEQAVTVGR